MRDKHFTILAVDLDETLLQTDLVWEALTELARHKPYLLLLVPFVLLGGRARLKRWLDGHVQLDIAAIPVNQSVLDFARACKAEGKTVVLATAALDRWARAAAKTFGCFDAIIATDKVNRTGKSKLAEIQRLCNGQAFAYIGDRGVDVPIWKAAHAAYIVGDPHRYTQRIGKAFAGAFPKPTATWRDWVALLRIAQWGKNLLVFVPLFLAHEVDNILALANAATAALLLSVLASSLYVLNDILDREQDRLHPTKSSRPLARRVISLQAAWLAVGIGLLLGFGTALVLFPAPVTGLLGTYAVASALYSFAFKHIALVDVLLLGGLYTLRILLGGVATGTEVSPWLLGFALSFFTGLAFLKRHSEVVHLRHQGKQYRLSRPYTSDDEMFLLVMGVGTSVMAMVILILYLTSNRVQELYTHPERLWLVFPALLFWVMRLWRLSVQGKLLSDPFSFAIRDRTSLAVAIGIAVLVMVIAR